MCAPLLMNIQKGQHYLAHFRLLNNTYSDWIVLERMTTVGIPFQIRFRPPRQNQWFVWYYITEITNTTRGIKGNRSSCHPQHAISEASFDDPMVQKLHAKFHLRKSTVRRYLGINGNVKIFKNVFKLFLWNFPVSTRIGMGIASTPLDLDIIHTANFNCIRVNFHLDT